MVSDKIGLTLHDKFSRGLALSDSEKQTLEAWYAQKDATEQIQLRKAGGEHAADNILQQAIAEAHERLIHLTERLQAMEGENEQIALENKQLREKLEKAIALQTV